MPSDCHPAVMLLPIATYVLKSGCRGLPAEGAVVAAARCNRRSRNERGNSAGEIYLYRTSEIPPVELKIDLEAREKTFAFSV